MTTEQNTIQDLIDHGNWINAAITQMLTPDEEEDRDMQPNGQYKSDYLSLPSDKRGVLKGLFEEGRAISANKNIIAFPLCGHVCDKFFTNDLLLTDAPLYQLTIDGVIYYIEGVKFRQLLNDNMNNSSIREVHGGDILFIKVNRQRLLDSAIR